MLKNCTKFIEASSNTWRDSGNKQSSLRVGIREVYSIKQRLATQEKGVGERELSVLIGLYELRALTTSNIRKRYGYPQWYVYKKLSELERRGYIHSYYTSGYARSSLQQGKYYRLGKRGIELLERSGYATVYNADELRVSEYYLPYLLSANELVISLEKHGWGVMDSRETKEYYHLNRSDNIHGTLRSPSGKLYPFMVLINPLGIRNIGKLKSEVARYPFDELLIFTRTLESFEQVIESFSENSDVYRYRTFRILPYSFSKYYLRKYDNHVNVLTYCEDRLSLEVLKKEAKFRFAIEGVTVVIHEGEEKYLINLLDNDLRKIHAIQGYHYDHYNRDGRPVLLLTNENLSPVHRNLLRHVHHVDYLSVNAEDFLNYDFS